MHSERDKLHNENLKLSQIKQHIEEMCRERQGHVAISNEKLKKFKEEETKKREEILQNFEGSFSEIQVKIDAQKKEDLEVSQENEKLREEIKLRIKEFEEKENTFIEQLKGKDEEFKSKFSE